MSSLIDSIYFTLLSDGRSAEDAAQTASFAFNTLKADRYQSVPIICGDRYEGHPHEAVNRSKLRGSLGNRRYYPLSTV